MRTNTRAEPLRTRIREAIDVGRLPSISSIKVSGGCGAAARCVCCDSPIGAQEIRLMIARTSGTDGLGEPVAMHPRCAQFWFDEAEKRQFDLARPDPTRDATAELPEALTVQMQTIRY
jgi:hypothetical protein